MGNGYQTLGEIEITPQKNWRVTVVKKSFQLHLCSLYPWYII